jgi:hypothetical protein
MTTLIYTRLHHRNILAHKMLDCIPARYVVAFLSFLGFIVNYALRININIAIVAMVNSSAIPHEELQGFSACGVHGSLNESLVEEAASSKEVNNHINQADNR